MIGIIRQSSVTTGRCAGIGGFTLVELMVALTISLIILAVVVTIFASSHATYTLEEGKARTQEAGRFSMEFLAQDIRMAGYAGCTSKLTLGTPSGSGGNNVANCPSGTICNIVSPSSAAVNMDPAGLKGYAYTGSGGQALSDWTPNLPSDFFSAGEVKPYTDVVVIQHASSLGTHLTGNTTPINANIQIIKTASIAGQLQAGDILMLSDCKSADVFQANNVSNGTTTVTIAHTNGNTQNFLTHLYDNSAELMKLVSRAYYIALNPNGEPALWRKDLTNVSGVPTVTSQELVEGIEYMRITYGEDTDATPNGVANRYRTANNVSSWAKVVDARVGILARTGGTVDQTVDTSSSSYTFDGVAVVPAAFTDKRRRQFYLSTIELRNH